MNRITIYISIGVKVKVIDYNNELIGGIYFYYEIGNIEQDNTSNILLENNYTVEIMARMILNISKIYNYK